MQRTSKLAILFLFLKSQAFVLQNNGRHNFKYPSRISVTQVEKLVVDEVKDDVIECDPEWISKSTALILDEESGLLSEDYLTHFFSFLMHFAKMENSEGAINIERLLERLENEVEAGNAKVSLSSKYYTIAIDTWGKSGDDDSVQHAERIFEKMEKMGISNPAIAPTRVTYNALMNAHARQGGKERIEQLLATMEKNPSVAPLTNDYNVLLWAHAKLGEARQAEYVLKRMIDRCKEGQSNCEPDLYSYNFLLHAWSKSNEKGRGKRAEAILERLNEADFNWDLDARTYSTTIGAIIRSGERDIITRVEHILARAEEQGIKSDVYLQTNLLDAYASSGTPGSAKKAEDLLEKLEKEGVANVVAYNTVIKAWRSSDDPDGLTRAKKIVDRMKMRGLADTISYSTLIAAYADKGNRESAERAEELLHDMHSVSLIPNTHAFNALMNAWIRCGEVEKAEQILGRMEKAYKNGDDNAIPNVVTYTSLMHGWATSEDPMSVEKTEKMFQRMKSMYETGNVQAKPNLFSYVTLINSIVRSERPDSAEKAETKVREMYEEYRKGITDVKPNAQLVSAVIDCWKKSEGRDKGERAEALLDWLIDIYEKEGDKSLRPNEFSFTSAIAAWATTRKLGKATRARAILAKMIKLHESGIISASPNIFSYTAVINSCAFCENDELEKREALQIAVKTYKESLKHATPNRVTFTTMLKALHHLLPACEKRAAAIETIFQKCAEDGQVGASVLRMLESTLDPDQLRKVVGIDAVVNGIVDIKRLPDEWMRNAKTRY